MKLHAWFWIFCVAHTIAFAAEPTSATAAEESQREMINRWLPEFRRPAARWAEMPTPELERTATAGDTVAAVVLARRLLESSPPRYEEARRWVEKAAEGGNPHACYLMGIHAINETVPGSHTITGDYEAARDWFAKGAALKHASAAYELGRLHFTGKLGQHDIPAAAQAFEQAAELGSVRAARMLGELYTRYTPETGTRVAPQPEKAVAWYRRAAEKGDAEAQFQLGRAYHRGFGAPIDASAAQMWWTRAAAAGSVLAQRALDGQIDLDPIEQLSGPVGAGRGAPGPSALPTPKPMAPDRAEVEQPDEEDRLHNAVNKGSAGARFALAQLFERRGTPEALDAALIEYGMLRAHLPSLADQAAIDSEAAIVRIYASNQLKSGPDDVTRAPLPRDPALLTDGSARMQLGELLWQGNAVVRADPTNAVRWFFHAAEAGFAPAMIRLGDLWTDGVNGTPDRAEALRWWRRAARLGDAEGQWRTGRGYAEGAGVAPDPVEAEAWLELAAGQKHPAAEALLKQMQPTLSAELRERAKERRTVLDGLVSDGRR